MDLDSIDITKLIFNGINYIIKKYENEYLMLNTYDLFNEKKINIYYILLKYILKDLYIK